MARVRFGVVGCGGFARWHLKCLLDAPEAEVVALCDPSEDALKQARAIDARLAPLPSHADHRALMERGDLDAVLISTPHTQHIGQIEDAFARGLHVLCDKPLCTSVMDVQRAIVARDRAAKLGMVSYQRHVEAPYVFLREKVRSGAIGEVRAIQALLCQNWRSGTSGKWRQDPDQSGGGFLLDSGSHILDAVLWITGLTPQSALAIVDHRGTPVDIDVSASVRFDGGAIAAFAFFGDAPEWFEEMRFYGTEGTLGIVAGRVEWRDPTGRRMAVESFPSTPSPDAHFARCVLGQEDLAATFEDAERTARLKEMIFAAGGRRELV